MNIIGIVITGIAVFISAISLIRAYSKDNKDSDISVTSGLSAINTKMDVMGGDVKDIRDEIKTLSIRQQDMGERLAKVEESTQSAHHRLDNIEDKIK